jgi:hypothetical protein
MNKKDVVIRVALHYTNPSKLQMLHLSNALFTGKETITYNRIDISNSDTIYKSEEWLHNARAIYRLSIDEWSDKTYRQILTLNTQLK